MLFRSLPPVLRPVAEIFPLTHAVRMARALDTGHWTLSLGIDLLSIAGFTVVTGWWAIRRLRKKLIQ